MITNKTKTALVAAGLILGTAPAFAATINNITFPDPTTSNQFFSGSVNENNISQAGDTLSGYGQITAINDNASFCASGTCQLTYTFDGYRVENINDGAANFSGGSVNFYSNNALTYDSTRASAATGDLFLSAVGNNVDGTYTLIGSGQNLTTNQAQGTGLGHLSVTGGAAADILDNNTYDNGDGTFADLLFNSSFSPNGDFMLQGSADLDYRNNGTPPPPPAVPEPSEIAVLGFGVLLIGLGVGYSRRRFDV